MPQVWKVSPLGQAGALIIFAILVMFAFIAGGPAGGIVMLILSVALAWLFVFRPAVVVTETEVVVRNPWGTQRIPLGDISGTGGAYSGLSIRRESGGTVVAWAVQKSNAAKWSGKASRADDVAGTIMKAVKQSRIEHAP